MEIHRYRLGVDDDGLFHRKMMMMIMTMYVKAKVREAVVGGLSIDRERWDGI